MGYLGQCNFHIIRAYEWPDYTGQQYAGLINHTYIFHSPDKKFVLLVNLASLRGTGPLNITAEFTLSVYTLLQQQQQQQLEFVSSIDKGTITTIKILMPGS